MHIPSHKTEKPSLTISLKDTFLFLPFLPDGWHMGQIHPPASSVSCNKTQFQPLLRHLLALCISKMISFRMKTQLCISMLKLDTYKKSHECDVLVNCILKNCNDIQWCVLRILLILSQFAYPLLRYLKWMDVILKCNSDVLAWFIVLSFLASSEISIFCC